MDSTDNEFNVEDFQDDLIGILISDVVDIQQKLVETNSKCLRRTLIRTVVSSFEGLLETVKNHVFLLDLTQGEILVLKEVSFEVDERGNVKEKKRYVPLERRIRLIIRILQRVESKYEIDLSDKGWQELVSTIQVRNRLTHPKNFEDLTVSNEELNDAFQSFIWFLIFALKVNDSAHTIVDGRIEKYKKQLEGIANFDR